MLGAIRSRSQRLLCLAIRPGCSEKLVVSRKRNTLVDRYFVNYHTSGPVCANTDQHRKELEKLLSSDQVTAKYAADSYTVANLVAKLDQTTPAEVFEQFKVVVEQQEAMAAVVPQMDRLRKSLEDMDAARYPGSVRAILDADERREDQLGLIQPATGETTPPSIADLYVNSDLSADEIFQAKNVGKYIKLSDKDFRKYLPEGVGGRIEELEFHTTKAKCLMIREPVLEAIKNLQAAEAVAFSSSKAPVPPIFEGMRGCGKSAAIAEVVFWARKKGWIVVYTPSGHEIVNAGGYLDKSEARRKEESCWDQPVLQYILLNKLMDAHADKLKKVSLKTKFELPKFTGSSLFDLVEYGSVLIQYTSQVWSILRSELALVTEFPVLLAVDEYNALYNPSLSFKDPESSKYKKEAMMPRQFTTAELFIDAHVTPKLAYGTFVGAMTEREPRRNFDSELPASSKPGFITVKPYNKQEFENAMKHYKDTDWVRDNISLGTREYVYQITSGFGHEVWRYTRRL